MRLSLDMIATWLAVVSVLCSLLALRYAAAARRAIAPEKFRELERDARQLLADFADNYDQLHTMLLRAAKRDERAKKAAEPPAGEASAGSLSQAELKAKKAELRRQFGLVR